MKPIYFPFTYLPDKVLADLGIFFSQIVVYQPSSLPLPVEIDAGRQSGQVAIRVPVAAGSDHLGQVVNAYQAWARQHQGAEFAYFKTRQGEVPFYDEASIHQIRTEIRRAQREDNLADDPGEEALQQLMQSRVFLHLAQEFDIQHGAISHSLNSQADMERVMLQNLQGQMDDEDFPRHLAQVPGTDQAGDYMVNERLAAWGALMTHDSETTGVLVTASRSALAAILDERSGVVEIGRFHGPRAIDLEEQPDWRPLFEAYLETLVKEVWPIDVPDPLTLRLGGSKAPEEVTLTVYLVTQTAPSELWGAALSRGTSADDVVSADGSCRNTVLALITHGGQTGWTLG
jgi:hypothetical protein